MIRGVISKKCHASIRENTFVLDIPFLKEEFLLFALENPPLTPPRMGIQKKR
jgi:hypothetical protein